MTKEKLLFRVDEKKYLKASEIVVSLEQAAQTIFIRQFDTVDVKLLEKEDRAFDGSEDNVFYFPVTVSDKI